MSTAWERLANEPILDIHPYQRGKPVEELERELGIPDATKLASNENPFSPSAGVIEALRKALAGFSMASFRNTVGTPEENARLVEALWAVLGEDGARR